MVSLEQEIDPAALVAKGDFGANPIVPLQARDDTARDGLPDQPMAEAGVDAHDKTGRGQSHSRGRSIGFPFAVTFSEHMG